MAKNGSLVCNGRTRLFTRMAEPQAHISADPASERSSSVQAHADGKDQGHAARDAHLARRVPRALKYVSVAFSRTDSRR